VNLCHIIASGYDLWWCADLAVYRRTVREKTGIQFVCPSCKLQPPSPNISFDIADVSFGVEDECLSDGDDDGVDADIPASASQTAFTLVEGGTKRKGKKKERIVLREIYLRTTGRHLSTGSHSVICHPTLDLSTP